MSIHSYHVNGTTMAVRGAMGNKRQQWTLVTIVGGCQRDAPLDAENDRTLFHELAD